MYGVDYPIGHPAHSCIGCPHDVQNFADDAPHGKLRRYGVSEPMPNGLNASICQPYTPDSDGDGETAVNALLFVAPWGYSAVSWLAFWMERCGERLMDGSNTLESWAYRRWVLRRIA